MKSQKSVSAYFSSKQILPFGFAEISSWISGLLFSRKVTSVGDDSGMRRCRLRRSACSSRKKPKLYGVRHSRLVCSGCQRGVGASADRGLREQAGQGKEQTPTATKQSKEQTSTAAHVEDRARINTDRSPLEAQGMDKHRQTQRRARVKLTDGIIRMT